MLKDVTLGQYFPGETSVHKLDPRTKLVLVIVYIVALFLAKGAASYALVAACLLAVIGISKIHLKVIVKSLKPLLLTSLRWHYCGNGRDLCADNAQFWHTYKRLINALCALQQALICICCHLRWHCCCLARWRSC